MIHRFISAIAGFFRSIFSKPTPAQGATFKKEEDVDEVARAFYKNLLDAESKNKHSTDVN